MKRRFQGWAFHSFQTKLTTILLAVVIGVTAALLTVIQEGVRQVFNDAQAESFAQESQNYLQRSDLQREQLADELRALAGHPRLVAAIEVGPSDGFNRFYSDLAQMAEAFLVRFSTEDQQPFMRFWHRDSGYAPLPRELDALGRPLPQDFLAQELEGIESINQDAEQLRAGFLPVGRAFFFVVVQPVIDEFGFLGDLVFGIPIERAAGSAIGAGFYPGFLQAERFFPLDPRINGADIASQVQACALDKEVRSTEFAVGHSAYRVSFLSLPVDPGFPPTELVALFPLDGRALVQGRIRFIILAAAAVALIGAYFVSVALSRRVTRPLVALEAASGRVAQGDFDVRVPVQGNDEVARLSGAFNEMTDGLALKERYRSVLEKVADQRVAEKLTTGSLELGGEERPVTVLFCDIRQFTPLTEHMAPREVVALLNEHMTALTAVVYAHQGVVDKFVGDELMALFGAPQSYGDDAVNAVRAAAAMLAARARLNATAERPCEIGIGIGSGPILAGLMGSEDRLQYTVLGARVNLAARLCSQAPPGQCLIDEVTAAALPEHWVAAEGCRDIRGFSAPVPLYGLRLDQINPSLTRV